MNLPIDPKGAAGAVKSPLGLVPPVAKRAIAAVLLHGAKKYFPWNWRRATVFRMTYAHAIQRHLDAWIDGEDIDPESGESHIAHIAASACIVLDAEDCGTLEDDRPPAPGKPPAAPSLSVPDAEPPSNIISFMDGSVLHVKADHMHMPDIRGVCMICRKCIGACHHAGPFGQCITCNQLP